MSIVEDGLGHADLPERWRAALAWFERRTGEEVTWAEITEGTGYEITTQKGIYKPAGAEHALSVRRALATDYDDRPVLQRDDGAWTMEYFQEGADPAQVLDHYTNRALFACQRDQTPIGVIEQISPRPAPRYRI